MKPNHDWDVHDPKTFPDDELLTPKQAFDKLQRKVSINTIYQAVENLLLPHYRVSGSGKRGKILIKLSDLLAWLESQRVDEPPDDGPFQHVR